MLAAWRERRYAAACCRRLLAQYQSVAAQHPELSGEPLYRKVVALHLGEHRDAVDDVMHGAQVSYANWPVDRDLMFRDVVHYLAVAGYCQGRSSQRWLRSNIATVIDQAIPAEL
jgi:hypothetical protein